MENISTFKFGNFETKTFFCTPGEISENALLVFDENTTKLFPERINKNSVILSPGEKEKGWHSIDKILKTAIDLSCGRDICFCGVGGGVVCDMTAFAASVYMRGCSVILVPTTLLAMVDAALGGKTGIDYQGYKNMVGTFYPAREVLYCPELLDSLPDKEYLSGIGEVIKTAMLGDLDLFDLLKEKKEEIISRDRIVLKEIIRRCIAVKGKIVALDLQENGIRATLNLGHTFGHALESVSGFCDWSHGEAVAWGLLMAIETGVKLGITNTDYAFDVRKMLEDYNFKLYADVDSEKLMVAMNQDKKKRNGKLQYILQENIEITMISEVEKDVIFAVLKENREKAGKK